MDGHSWEARTFALQSLLHQPPEQAATVVTEGGAHVVVNLEPVRHVDVEPFFLELGSGGGGGHRSRSHGSSSPLFNP